MEALRQLARKLLTEGAVRVVVGWEEGPRGARPAFITAPEEADRLIFDTRCVHNLAAFMSPRRTHLVSLGKAAVVVKGCDARSIAGLVRETQLKREQLVLIGVRCGGVLRDPTSKAALSPDTVADRCTGCAVREPHLVDHLVGELPPAPPERPERAAKLAELQAMPPEERWSFWRAELSRCVRCHACREVCPMCFCERCVADKTEPAWIDPSAHLRGNVAWQLTRVLHLAGRCADCGECERACPADIPLGLLNTKVANVMEERFGYRTVDDPSVPCPVGTWKADDRQEFIL